MTTLEEIEVRVDFESPGRAAAPTALAPDPVFDAVWASVLNPVQRSADGHRAVRPVVARKPGGAGLPADYFDDAA